MKILVTGGAGFLGSHICELFKNKGYDVLAIDNLTKHELKRTEYNADTARQYNIDFLKKIGVELQQVDIRNKEKLMELSKDVDFIAHTAAQPAMTISWENPELDFSTNVRGTFNLLEVARKYDIPLANCATIHVYGPKKINESLIEKETRYVREPLEIDENEPILQGTMTPLHASKRAAELYVQTYIDTYNLKVASFRLTGIYGTRQFGGEDHGWVANFAIKTLAGRSLTIYGNGKVLRDILYVKDAAEAFYSYINNPKPGIYNIGGGKENMISLIECIKLIEELSDKKAQIKYDKDRFGDLRYFVTDYSKFTRATGWKPKVLPSEGVKKLIDWIKDNQKLFSQ